MIEAEKDRSGLQAIAAGVLIFGLTAGVGLSVTWLGGQQDTERTRSAVSQTAADRAGALQAELGRTAAAAHALGAVLATGAAPNAVFNPASERVLTGIGGTECLQWAVGGHVKHVYPRDKCKALLGDATHFPLFRTDGGRTLNGPVLLPTKRSAFIARLVVSVGERSGTISSIVDVQRAVAAARLDELPGEGYSYTLIAPTQGDRVLASSAAQARDDEPIAETSVQLGNVTLMLRIGRTAASNPSSGWTNAIVMLLALLLARIGQGFVLQISRFHAERRTRLRVEEKLAATLERVGKLEEERRRSAHSDRITGLPDARYLSRFLDRNWLNYNKEGKPIALMLVEIDRFDALFKASGPKAAEAALKQVGEVIGSRVMSDGEIACRFRGTAFGLFFCDGAAAPEHRGKQIRRAVEELAIDNSTSGVAPYLTVSIGIATGIPGRSDTIRSFTQAAEDALKVAREKGQNRVIVRRFVSESKTAKAGAA